MNKLLKTCIALAALAAFAVLPASAAATNNPLLVTPNTTAVPTGTNIVATNHGALILTNGSSEEKVSCATAALTGTLTVNSHAGGIQGNIETASFTGNPKTGEHGTHCYGDLGSTTVTPTVSAAAPWCISSTPAMATDTFTVRGGKCSEAAKSIKFTLDVTSFFGTISCGYESTAALTGKVVATHPTQATLTLTKAGPFKRVHGSELCPTEGFLDQSFTLFKEINKVESAVSIWDAT